MTTEQIKQIFKKKETVELESLSRKINLKKDPSLVSIATALLEELQERLSPEDFDKHQEILLGDLEEEYKKAVEKGKSFVG